MADVRMGDEHGISVIDFGAFLNGAKKQEVADAMLKSFQDTGFVYLVNHGISQDKVQSMFDWSKKFFSLPQDIKMLAPHPSSGTHHRGYSAPGAEKVTQHVYDSAELAKIRGKAPDVKESFESGREDDIVQPNIWLPEDALPGFRNACLNFFWTCREAELNILKALALGLNLPEGFLLEYHSAVDNQLRLLRYPSVPVEQLEREEVARIGAHSDFGSITLLLQDDVGGLEIEDPNNPGTFLSASPVEGALIVNAGDTLARWSNDTIRSTIHRVRAPPNSAKDGVTPERYSIPYFCSADFSAMIDCLPGTYSEERPKKYEPVTAGQYVLYRLAQNY
ncbi:thymine dioxygenase [Obba rivulosa]|uniref:Thymine dioxygenase n=1 Tax=Obba rivulosa TaxID=1052685 RepID=A0A8E2DN08_9APHY|nr:thymine dioxygenase [Obba rivulosa]